MAKEFDVVIRGGSIMDGNGGEPFVADVAVTAGKIAAVGKVGGAGAEEIDAGGLSVTPGFVDLHTHYDGQAMWDSHLAPSSWHGVTTVVMGNCGVGFAPVRKDTQDKVVALMEGVEDLPGPYLERVIDCNLTRLSRLLRILRFHAHDLNLKPSVTVYMRRGKGPKQRLRFTKTGDAKLEQAYSTHLMWPGKRPFHSPPSDPDLPTSPAS